MPDPTPGPRNLDGLFLALAIFLSLVGMAGFVFLFVKDFNVYWLMLSPVILALYQIPAVFVFWLLKRRRAARQAPPPGPPEDSDPL